MWSGRLRWGQGLRFSLWELTFGEPASPLLFARVYMVPVAIVAYLRAAGVALRIVFAGNARGLLLLCASNLPAPHTSDPPAPDAHDSWHRQPKSRSATYVRHHSCPPRTAGRRVGTAAQLSHAATSGGCTPMAAALTGRARAAPLCRCAVITAGRPPLRCRGLWRRSVGPGGRHTCPHTHNTRTPHAHRGPANMWPTAGGCALSAHTEQSQHTTTAPLRGLHVVGRASAPAATRARAHAHTHTHAHAPPSARARRGGGA